MIPFNKPAYVGNEDYCVLDAIRNNKIAGDGKYSKFCQEWFDAKLGCAKSMLTPNCTQALEMAAILIDIQPGDEVIMPSYTFVSTANAFVLRGARIIFVDIRPDTMNMDESLVERAITSKTKALVPVHYAGVACDMDIIMELADRNGLYVIEDAAQGMMSTYKGRPLGSIGDIGAYSFHETKNYTSGGEGGLLIVNDQNLVERAEIIREKGTDRSKFFMGLVDKYSWVDIGSSYLPSELQAAYLYGQLEHADSIFENRLVSWNYYNEKLKNIEAIELPTIPEGVVHNAHMFYIKVNDFCERNELISYLKENDILSVFHYVPLHGAYGGKLYGQFSGNDVFTTVESERLIRLPLYYGMKEYEIDKVVGAIQKFFMRKEGRV